MEEGGLGIAESWDCREFWRIIYSVVSYGQDEQYIPFMNENSLFTAGAMSESTLEEPTQVTRFIRNVT